MDKSLESRTRIEINNSLYDIDYREHHFVINLIAVMLIFSMTMHLGPHFQSDAATVILSHKNVLPAWSFTIPDLPAELDEDLQKATDIWKSSPKTLYTYKSLTVQNYIWQYLTVEMGLPDIAAAGVFGNMMVESGNRSFNVRPYVYSPGQAYYGLCQWNTGGHHSGINGGTLEEQMEYLENTIESEMHSSNYQRFLNADTPEEASVIFGQWYERCATPDSRQNEARRAYERFVG